MTVPCYSAAGVKQVACDVPADVFGLEKTNPRLIKAAYEHYLSNRRVNLAKTKTRGEVRGGRRKPWQQKKLGRARVGSSRNPIWRGGGIAFGPLGIENYSKKLNKKAKSLALRHALSVKRERTLSLKYFTEDGKTATLHKLLYGTLKLERRVLLVGAGIGADSPQRRAARNLPEVELTDLRYLNVFKALNADWLVFTADALEKLKEKEVSPAAGR